MFIKFTYICCCIYDAELFKKDFFTVHFSAMHYKCYYYIVIYIDLERKCIVSFYNLKTSIKSKLN